MVGWEGGYKDARKKWENWKGGERYIKKTEGNVKKCRNQKYYGNGKRYTKVEERVKNEVKLERRTDTLRKLRRMRKCS